MARWHDRSAPQEAIQHLTDALALLNHLPETPAQVRQELRLQLALAPALWATKGYAAPELEQAYVRARQLCTQPADVPQLFAASYGLYAVYIYRAELSHASELGQHLLRIAEQHQDRTLLLGAHDIRSCALFHGGQFVQARVHTEAGVTLYAPDTHDALVALYGADVGISCYSWSALTLCVLGYIDQGRQRNDEALALARAISHPFSLAYALLFAAYVHGWCREVDRVQEHTETLITLATDYGFADCLAQGKMLHGWACALQGQGQEGVAEIHAGLVGYRALGQEIDRPYYLALLAEAYGLQGQAEAGLEVLAEAQGIVGAMPGYAFEAGLYQLQGELLQQAPRRPQCVTQTPEACLQQALAIARRQQAKVLELRAAMSLSRLWQQQGKREEARQLLAEVYGWFREGFDTADLQAAKALMKELGS